MEENGYKLISSVDENTKYKDKLKMQCKKTGYFLIALYSEIKVGQKPLPFHPSNPYVVENIKTYITNNAQGFELLSSNFTRADHKNLEWRCPKGHTFTRDLRSFINNQNKCLVCRSPNSIASKEHFLEILGEEFVLLSDYVGVSIDVKLRHICGKEIYIQPWNFMNLVNKCSWCSGYRKDTEKFKQEVFSMFGDEYKVLGEYVTAHEEIKMYHRECNKEFYIRPTNLLERGTCPSCFLKDRVYDQDSFERKVYELVGDEYSVVGEYKDANTHISMRHNECGNIWKVPVKHFIGSETRCPKCRPVSIGEAILFENVQNLLKSEEYEVKSGYWFDDCRGLANSPYYFDITIFKNGEIVCIIERHGAQHYKFIPIFHADLNGFEHQKKRDRDKEEYCQKKNIPLLIIDATDTTRDEEFILAKDFILRQINNK